MPATPHLHLEGHLVATAEVVEMHRHDRDEWHQLFLFRAGDGCTLVTFTRSETYGETCRLAGGVLDVLVDHAADVRLLEELVPAVGRFPRPGDSCSTSVTSTTTTCTCAGLPSGCAATSTSQPARPAPGDDDRVHPR